MAVLPECPGLIVTVQANKAALEEYDEPECEAQVNEVTKYVRSTEDTDFAVHIEVKKDYRFIRDSIDAEVWLDGVRVQQCLLNQKNFPITKVLEGVTKFDGRRWTIQKFQFSSLITSESSSACCLKNRTAETCR
jgi:hypothetical protein